MVPDLREGEAARRFEPSLAPDITCVATLPNHGYVRDPKRYVTALGQEVVAQGGEMVTGDVRDIVLDGGAVQSLADQYG